MNRRLSRSVSLLCFSGKDSGSGNTQGRVFIKQAIWPVNICDEGLLIRKSIIQRRRKWIKKN